MTFASAPDDDPKPQPPREPETGECCGGGCNPCIYDHYWEAMDRYEEALRLWEVRQKSHDGTV